jgi:hypothetical protein
MGFRMLVSPPERILQLRSDVGDFGVMFEAQLTPHRTMCELAEYQNHHF